MRTEAIAPDDGSKHQKMENIFMTYFIGIIIRFKLTEVSDVELVEGITVHTKRGRRFIYVRRS